jgi:hypothetical protein
MEEKLMVYIQNAISNIMSNNQVNNSAKDD